MNEVRENQLSKTVEFEQDRGQIRVNKALACTVPPSVMLKLLGMARPQVGPKPAGVWAGLRQGGQNGQIWKSRLLVRTKDSIV
jgi:hypothetical protein